MDSDNVMNKENKKPSRMKTNTEYGRIFRQNMGQEAYNEYIKPYQKKYNAKEETKALRRKTNALYYERKKAERLAIQV
jgi:hypothetical protein